MQHRDPATEQGADADRAARLHCKGVEERRPGRSGEKVTPATSDVVVIHNTRLGNAPPPDPTGRRVRDVEPITLRR